MPLAFHSGLSALAQAYEGFLCDVWGVIHDGGAAFPFALEGLARLKARGRQVLLLSNAPRAGTRVAAQLAEKGLKPELYRGIVTSGDTTRHALAAGGEPLGGSRFFHLGPDRDAGLLDGLACRSAARLDEADFILCTGPLDIHAPLDALDPVLDEALRRDLLFICANPDRTVVRQGVPEPCAGALAERYAARGGRVRRYGKPGPEIYALALERLGLPRTRIVALGDGLATDIAGANGAGIDAVLITSGVLRAELGCAGDEAVNPSALERAIAASGAQPAALLEQLSW